MLVEVAVGIITVMYVIYFYLTKNYDHWKKKGIPYIEPEFPFGVSQRVFLGKTDIGSVFLEHYLKYKGHNLKYVGAFFIRHPALILLDLDLCKQILSKDFNHFTTRGLITVTHEYITKHLFSLKGQQWREMRTKLTPTFTSGKMKNMFILMEKCAEQLQEHIEQDVLEKGEFEVKNLMARFTTDIIASCAFGLEVNSIKNHDDEFFKTGQLIFVRNKKIIAKAFMHHTFPEFASFLKLNMFNSRISDHLTSIVKETLMYRKKNNVTRNDFVDLLIKIKENKSLEDHDKQIEDQNDSNTKYQDQLEQPRTDGLTLEEMTAQAFVFFAAGFETAASTTSFCVYELAKNMNIQERLREEVDEVLGRHDNRISYQALQEMCYMEQVLNETLRMYASLPVLTRVCTERYQFPGTDLVIDEGVRVYIPTYAIHHDKDIYPDPYMFDPDRFSEENIKQRHPYAFLPFGEGPRYCIGMRFGKLQVKIGLAAILSKYELSLAEDTPEKLEISPFIFTTPKYPFSLKITKRQEL